MIPAQSLKVTIMKKTEVLKWKRNDLFKAGETSNSLPFIVIKNVICTKTTSNIGRLDSGEGG